MSHMHQTLAAELAGMFAELPQVEAVALGGSQRSGVVDPASDIDLYVFTRAAVPLELRQTIVARSGGASRADLDLNYWGPGDEWYHAPSGIEVDIVYFDADWMSEQIERVVVKHHASAGYTTCLWYTVRHSLIFHDPQGWLGALHTICQAAYPEPLRRNIIAHNHPLLRGIIPAYAHQIEKAVQRGDLLSLNHRLAALFASYFDILFAFNRQLHPGEKRLLTHTRSICPRLPVEMAADLQAVLTSAAVDTPALPGHVARLLDRLDARLAEDNLI